MLLNTADENNIGKEEMPSHIIIISDMEFDSGVYNFAVNCPNFGAPVKHLGGNSCDYCGTYVEPINLKNWFISSCKEK